MEKVIGKGKVMKLVIFEQNILGFDISMNKIFTMDIWYMFVIRETIWKKDKPKSPHKHIKSVFEMKSSVKWEQEDCKED